MTSATPYQKLCTKTMLDVLYDTLSSFPTGMDITLVRNCWNILHKLVQVSYTGSTQTGTTQKASPKTTITVHYYVEKMSCILQQVKRDGEYHACHTQGTMDSPKTLTLHLLCPWSQHEGQPSAFPHKRLDHPSHAAELVLRAAAAGCRCAGQRMERASLAGLNPGTSSCTPAQAGDKASAHLTAQQEFDPVPEPSGLQSSLFLILPPEQPKGCSQGWLWPLPRPRDAL